jgi:histidyl-tRNA synthetase
VQRLLEKAARKDPARAIRSAIDFISRLHSLAGPLETALPELQSLLQEYHLDTRPLEEVRAALELFSCYGSRPAEITIDLSLGRGLRYYTGLVFEIYHDSADGALQLCGGGRYDELVRALGARSAVPACGFSFGLERVDLCLIDDEAEEPIAADLLLAVMEVSAAADAVRAAEAARATGVRVELDLRPSAARGAVRRAVRARIPLVAMLGSRERADGQILLRRLKDRSEQHVSLADFAAAVGQAL